jgi:hypothetical protein
MARKTGKSTAEQFVSGIAALMPPHRSDTALSMPPAIALPQTLPTREILRMILAS